MRSHRVPRSILSLLLALAAGLACTEQAAPPPANDLAYLDLAYLDITALQERMESGELTAVELVRFHLQRIEELDRSGPNLRSII